MSKKTTEQLRNEYLESLKNDITKVVKENISYLQKYAKVKVRFVRFSWDTEYQEVDVFLYDEDGNEIELEEKEIYQDLSEYKYFSSDFISEHFYSMEHWIKEVGWENKEFDAKEI